MIISVIHPHIGPNLKLLFFLFFLLNTTGEIWMNALVIFFPYNNESNLNLNLENGQMTSS